MRRRKLRAGFLVRRAMARCVGAHLKSFRSRVLHAEDPSLRGALRLALGARIRQFCKAGKKARQGGKGGFIRQLPLVYHTPTPNTNTQLAARLEGARALTTRGVIIGRRMRAATRLNFLSTRLAGKRLRSL